MVFVSCTSLNRVSIISNDIIWMLISLFRTAVKWKSFRGMRGNQKRETSSPMSNGRINKINSWQNGFICQSHSSDVRIDIESLSLCVHLVFYSEFFFCFATFFSSTWSNVTTAVDQQFQFLSTTKRKAGWSANCICQFISCVSINMQNHKWKISNAQQ